jgi:tetratricopeptide (TPR) repeat protein
MTSISPVSCRAAIVRRARFLFRATTFLLSCVALSEASAQTPTRPSPPGLPPGVTREQMWPAPTAEDWKRPCLIQWQRTYADAVAVAKQTGKPILVCVNMDGEIASEHYAGIRYRDPEIAKLYDAYVCVIASVYRHTPRDYDEQGRRIPCPRFGTVTCGEHIAIEPGLFEKFFKDQRVAPRHIGIEPGSGEPNAQKEVYDVFFSWDTDTVFNSLRDGIAMHEGPTVAIRRSDRPLEERVASRDSVDRDQVETDYLHGDAAQKRALLEAAIGLGGDAPPELLRLAVFGNDAELSRLARKGLAQTSAPEATGAIAEALRTPMEAPERAGLLAALERIGESSPKARMLSVAYRGIGGRSDAVKMDQWQAASAAPSGSVTAAAELPAAVADERLAKSDATLRSQDPSALLDLAEAGLSRADRETDDRFARMQRIDARDAALRAEKRGASGWRVNELLAVASFHLGDRDDARARAERAMADSPADPTSANAMVVLALFAEARWTRIAKATNEKQPWPPEWLTDVHAAYEVLARHPCGTDGQVAGHYDVVKWLGAKEPADQILKEGLRRFADSPMLHERLRGRILEEHGIEGLEPAYETLLEQRDAPPAFDWFAGYASTVVAEFRRRNEQRDEALAAYERAIAHYERYLASDPEDRSSSDAAIALALAGRAKIHFERGDLTAAVADLVTSFERDPSAAGVQDGLGITPVETGKLVASKLATGDAKDLREKLARAMERLDPELLLPPPDERRAQGGAGARAGR